MLHAPREPSHCLGFLTTPRVGEPLPQPPLASLASLDTRQILRWSARAMPRSDSVPIQAPEALP